MRNLIVMFVTAVCFRFIMLQTLRRKQKYQITNAGVEKIKLSRLLVQRINEFKMNEIQLKTPQQPVLTYSNCKLFLGLELTSYIQVADDSNRTDSPA